MAMTERGLLVLCLLVGVAQGGMIIKGCANAFIRLQCSADDSLQVNQVSVEEDREAICSSSAADSPPVPAEMAHLCASSGGCVYQENICLGKNDCAFFVGGVTRDRFGRSINKPVVVIDYSCSAGIARLGGMAGFIVVTVALLISMAVIIVLLTRKATPDEDTSKYVEFENRLSRSPSMSSEISAKIKDRRDADKDEEATVGKSTVF